MRYIWFLLLLVCISPSIHGQTESSFKPLLVYVNGGSNTLLRNSLSDNSDADKDSIASFYIGMYEVSVGEYNHFCKVTGYSSIVDGESNMPITNITATDAEAYCDWLSREHGGTWRLPTSREWDYAQIFQKQLGMIVIQAEWLMREAKSRHRHTEHSICMVTFGSGVEQVLFLSPMMVTSRYVAVSYLGGIGDPK